MKTIICWLKGIVFLIVLLCISVPVAFATPAIPVDRDKFSIGDTITAEITAYGVKAQHTGYKEDKNKPAILYTRKGTADPAQPLRFIVTAKQSLQNAVQEVEITMQPYSEMNRYAGQKLKKFYRKVQGSAGKRVNANVEYKLPPKSRLLVVTLQLKDYYKEGTKTLPRYTTVEYELKVVGLAEASANPLRDKNVKVVRDSKGKRMIIEKKGTNAAVAAVGIGIPVLAALGYWFLYRRKKK